MFPSGNFGMPQLFGVEEFANTESHWADENDPTATRAALTAVGFFLGLAPASGKRAHSTVATRRSLGNVWFIIFSLLREHCPWVLANRATCCP